MTAATAHHRWNPCRPDGAGLGSSPMRCGSRTCKPSRSSAPAPEVAETCLNLWTMFAPGSSVPKGLHESAWSGFGNAADGEPINDVGEDIIGGAVGIDVEEYAAGAVVVDDRRGLVVEDA